MLLRKRSVPPIVTEPGPPAAGPSTRPRLAERVRAVRAGIVAGYHRGDCRRCSWRREAKSAVDLAGLLGSRRAISSGSANAPRMMSGTRSRSTKILQAVSLGLPQWLHGRVRPWLDLAPRLGTSTTTGAGGQYRWSTSAAGHRDGTIGVNLQLFCTDRRPEGMRRAVWAGASGASGAYVPALRCGGRDARTWFCCRFSGGDRLLRGAASAGWPRGRRRHGRR